MNRLQRVTGSLAGLFFTSLNYIAAYTDNGKYVSLTTGKVYAHDEFGAKELSELKKDTILNLQSFLGCVISDNDVLASKEISAVIASAVKLVFEMTDITVDDLGGAK